MQYIKEKNSFESTDISLVSALLSCGCKLEAIDRSNSSRALFIIERTKELDGLIQGYWSHTLKVDPLDYFNVLREIKTRLHQTIR